MGKGADVMKEIKIPFNKWSENGLLSGQKVCTSRHEQYGEPGDYFYAANGRFRLQLVIELPLWFVKEFLWHQEGAGNPQEFEAVWKSLHRGKFKADENVWTHFFFNPHRIPSMNESAYPEGLD